MKVALVHDQLLEFGGAERVLVALKETFPKADIFTSFYNPKTLGSHADKFKNSIIKTSWADKIPFFKKLYSPLRFITPWIWESFDFSGYDLVISSSGAYMSKGIITKPGTVHICYLHHQPRYLYYYETAMEWQKYLAVKIYAHLINHDLRIFDYISSQRVNYFIANSEETKRRIEKYYRRDATVIYPPVQINPIPIKSGRNSKQILNYKSQNFKQLTINNQQYYLTVSRLARAKHIDILIKAANKMKFNFKIVGSGRDESYLKSLAGKTVEFLGNISDEKLPKLYLGAKAFLFSAVDEEFGIAQVESMGYGIPVIAFNSGGVPETVKNGYNGFLFNQLDPSDLLKKIKLLESLPEKQYVEMQKNARKTAENFSTENFKKNILAFVNRTIHAE